jgi:hypothetical protein
MARHLRKTLLGSAVAGAALLSASVGCEQTGVEKKDETLPSQEGPQIRYTPIGCSYEVTTPKVDLAKVGGKTPSAGAPLDVHVAYAADPSSTIAVTWRGDADGDISQVFYGTDKAKVEAYDGTGELPDGVLRQEGHSMVYQTLDLTEKTRINEVHVCGLQPTTKYFYKVGNTGAFSTVYDFVTAPTAGSKTKFRFAITGDARNDVASWAKAQQAILASGSAFQLSSGDAVVTGISQLQWNSFFGAEFEGVKASDVMARVPVLVANGNHDDLTTPYLAQFAVPQEKSAGENGDGEEWYSFDYGNAHFVVLNDTTASDSTTGQEEANWLRADLAKVDRAKTPWIIAMHHKPMYSCSPTHGSDTGLRSSWGTIYDQFKVDFVFNGHVHNYERTKPIRGVVEGASDGAVVAAGPNGIPVKESGTVYIVAAGVGAPLYGAGNDCNFTQLTESVRNYVVVDIEDRTFSLKAYRLDGSVLDEFTYTK